MPEDRVHKMIRLLMVAALLLLAYLLPEICIKRMEKTQYIGILYGLDIERIR